MDMGMAPKREVPKEDPPNASKIDHLQEEVEDVNEVYAHIFLKRHVNFILNKFKLLENVENLKHFRGHFELSEQEVKDLQNFAKFASLEESDLAEIDGILSKLFQNLEVSSQQFPQEDTSSCQGTSMYCTCEQYYSTLYYIETNKSNQK
jgi:hypothetical protein